MNGERARLPSDVFDLPVEKMRDGYYSDAYFVYTKVTLEREHHHPHVLMQVFQRHRSVLGGMDEAIAVLRECSGSRAGDGSWIAGWDALTVRTCRELGGFDPDIRHRTNDSVISLALVAAGQALTLMPRLVGLEDRPGIAVRAIAEGAVDRTIFMATRTADAKRPSVVALRDAVRAAAAAG